MFGTSGNSPTASAADSGGVGSSGANSGIDYAATTDDQILDLDESEADDEGTDGAGDSGQGGEDDAEVVDLNAEGDDGGEGEGQEEEGEEEQDEEAEGEEQTEQDGVPRDATSDPQQYRAIFKAHPDLRNAFYTSSAYREQFPTVAEARQYREAIPTLEDLQATVAARDDLQKLDTLFYDDPGTFIEEMNAEDPQAFERIAQTFPNKLYELNPQAYSAHIATPAVQGALANLMRLAASKGPDGKNLQNAIEVISLNLFGKRFAELADGRPQVRSPREREIEQRERALNERETAAQTTAFRGFVDKTNESVTTGVVKAIENSLRGDPAKKIKGVLEGTPLAKNERAFKRIVKDVFDQVDASIKGNRTLTSQLQRLFQTARKGGLGKDQMQPIQSLLMQRANQLIPVIAAKVVGEYTAMVVGENRQRIENQRRASGRPDVTGAAGSGRTNQGPRPRVSTKDIDYNRTSDDDILSGKVTVRRRK